MLIDGHSIAFRAFYALPPEMQTSSGQQTNAVYGFVSMLIKAVSEYRPDRVVVVFDPPGKTFREERYAEYKAQRSETPEPFREQEPLIREVIDALGLPQIQVEGFEADDVIATLAARATENGDEVLVVTGDRDSFQLVRDPLVKVIYNRRGITDVVGFDEKAIKERYGITPDQYVDYAALRGDASDNIPGVPGVGEKTAAKLLQKYGSIEGIFDHIDELTPKLRDSLLENRSVLERNRELMRLRLDAPVPEDLEALERRSPDPKKLEELFSALEFRTLLARAEEAFGVRATSDKSKRPIEPEYQEIDETRFEDLVRSLSSSKARVSISATLAGSEDSGKGRSVFLGVLADGKCNVVRLEGIVDPWEETSDRSAANKAARRLLSDKRITKDGHNLVRTGRILGHPPLEGVGIDTAVASYLLNPGAVAEPNLAQILEEYAGVRIGAGQQSLDLGADGASAAADAAAVAELSPILGKKLEEAGMRSLYEEIERPLVGILASMEAVGIKLDGAYLNELYETFGFEAQKHESEVKRLAGDEELNVRSTQQLAAVLFEKLNLPPVKSTKTGYSTDASSLEALRDAHPIVEEILAFREVERLRTVVGGLAKLIGPDGRVHPHYNQTGAATGRISSDNPNVQNVPIRTSLGRQIRKAFIAEPGWVLITADYSQIELRVMAHISGDEGLRKALSEAHDVHSETAASVFGVSVKDVTEEMRRAAKMVNYGLSYGLEAYGLAQRLGIETDQAKEIIDRYFESFPGVRKYMEDVVAKAKETGYTETLFGRRRYIPQLKSQSYQVRRMGERMAMNAPIQGTAADIIKRAMVGLESRLRSQKMRARQILQVHDEIVVEAPEGESDRAADALRDAMTGAADLAVPLEVEMGMGRDWDEAKSAAGA